MTVLHFWNTLWVINNFIPMTVEMKSCMNFMFAGSDSQWKWGKPCIVNFLYKAAFPPPYPSYEKIMLHDKIKFALAHRSSSPLKPGADKMNNPERSLMTNSGSTNKKCSNSLTLQLNEWARWASQCENGFTVGIILLLGDHIKASTIYCWGVFDCSHIIHVSSHHIGYEMDL